MPNLVGTGLNQVPTNGMLGGLAYQDPNHASIKDLDLKNLSQINSEIVDTAVDVFVYDTRKDSDGGAWRKRTQNTSWYNETLGTATRGSRKEFPAVAVLVLESLKLTIYDGDDPDLPMWMEFINTSGNLIGGSAMTAVTALNGIIVTGSGGYTMETRFISDYSLDWFTNQLFEYKGNIEQRNDTLGFRLIESYGIVNSATNDVAMTVLPNAPIDPSTGLPVPTIAVATNGGTSVIKDNGIVVDFNDALGSTRPVSTVAIRGNDILHWNVNNGTLQQFFDALSAPTDSTNDVKYNYTVGGGHATCENISALLRVGSNGPYYLAVRDSKSIAAAAQSGMSVFVDGIDRTFSTNSTTIFDSRVAYITSDYNTGWMHGDVKGAFLSDTSTTFTYGSELVTNGTFASDISGWTGFNSVLTHQTDAIRVADNGSYSKAYRSFTTVVGKEYVVKVVVKTISGGAAHCNTGSQNPADASGNDFTIITNITATGTYYNTFTANATTSYIEVWSDGVNYVEYSELSVKENAPGLLDRSVNNKGLAVYGTVTKSAVATGADLVAYSGFTNSNYLKQPYYSGMDFGIGDMSVSFWMKIAGNISDTGYVYDRQGASGNRHAIYLTTGNSGSLFFYFASGGGVETSAINLNDHKDTWACYTCNRNNSGLTEIYINGQLRGSSILAVKNLTNVNADTYISTRHTANSPATYASFALFKFSAAAPTAEQVKKMYEDEKVLFQENAKATLYGSSDAVTALAYDEVTDQLHVGTSSGRSDFQGLRRINNTATAVTTAISAHDTFIIEQ
jgi:hypothetical protein